MDTWGDTVFALSIALMMILAVTVPMFVLVWAVYTDRLR